MNLDEVEIDKELDEKVLKQFLLREKEYMEIAEQNVINNFSKFIKGSSKTYNYMETMFRTIINQYNSEISTIKRKIKDKVIVETIYPKDMKARALKRFPPYI